MLLSVSIGKIVAPLSPSNHIPQVTQKMQGCSMKIKLIVILAGVLLSSGCAVLMEDLESENRTTSSLVKFLYPEGEYQTHKIEVPTLKLPVRVGIAFIPNASADVIELTTQQEVNLLTGVRKSFSQYQFVDRIEIIPSAYLMSGGGFTNLEQVSRIYDVDIMALVSYDQVSRSRLNNASLLYWTIVGAYLVHGNSNETRTFVDTAVFDIESRKLLFRAPGIDRMFRIATAAGASDRVRMSSDQSFQNAVEQMSANLDQELSAFKDRVRTEKVAKIAIREGYTRQSAGASSTDYLFLFLLLLLVLMALRSLRLSHLST